MCEHTPIIKDGASQNETYKIAICSKCLTVLNVQPRNEKPSEASVWDKKDRRMARMSAIKSAVEMGGTTTEVLETANKYLEWIYLP